MKYGEHEKRSGLGALDWFLLVLTALVLLGGLFWYLWRRSVSEGDACVIYYTVRIYDVERMLIDGEEARELIPEGSAVFSGNGTARLGEVQTYHVRPHRSAGVREGEVIFSEVPDRVDVDVLVRCNAFVRAGDGIRADDVRIAAGESGTFRFGSFYAPQALVISVEREVAE